ncbi:hypothetical protein [Pontibacter russatus]|uniref:hypothetical protein n=1 Tax=Pontibacter russatus TaxID=2694929 RepID=UPI00137AE846|nr:hypothetical protein [Pontibacter russatus]
MMNTAKATLKASEVKATTARGKAVEKAYISERFNGKFNVIKDVKSGKIVISVK